jgi:polyhydroxyalkanoate synthesis repressor PhaR
MASKRIVIKKYENRRLYDTTNSRYVNLDEVAQLLQAGNEVQVTDAVSGEDITRLILTQIIVEDAKAPDSSFPLDLLRQMVVASGRATQENSLKYMKAMLDVYQNAYRAMTPPLNPFEFMQNLRPDRDAPVNPGRTPAPETAPIAGQQDTKPPQSEEVEMLKGRLAELEKMVASLATAPAKRGTR